MYAHARHCIQSETVGGWSYSSVMYMHSVLLSGFSLARCRFRCLSLPFPPRVAPGRTRSAWLTAKGIGAWRIMGVMWWRLLGVHAREERKWIWEASFFSSVFFFVCVISRPFWNQLHEVREQDEGFFSVLKGESRQRFVEICEAAYMQTRLAKYSSLSCSIEAVSGKLLYRFSILSNPSFFIAYRRRTVKSLV